MNMNMNMNIHVPCAIEQVSDFGWNTQSYLLACGPGLFLHRTWFQRTSHWDISLSPWQLHDMLQPSTKEKCTQVNTNKKCPSCKILKQTWTAWKFDTIYFTHTLVPTWVSQGSLYWLERSGSFSSPEWLHSQNCDWTHGPQHLGGHVTLGMQRKHLGPEHRDCVCVL